VQVPTSISDKICLQCEHAYGGAGFGAVIMVLSHPASQNILQRRRDESR